MALCVYHETTEAAQACRVCKQDVCSKCLEYGEDGMCGMCLEMANARKATAEAARQARTEAAATAPAAAPKPRAPQPAPAARPPAKTPTGKPGGGPGAPGAKSPTGKPAAGPNGAPAKAPPPKSPTGPKPGFCAQHPDQKASASCTHCEKKVCPYCLDLYDLCADCRNLPSCARHESMVAQSKCVSCKMDYCKVCLAGTDQCDRCRAIGAPKDPGMVKAQTQNLAGKAPPKGPGQPKAKGTTELKMPPGGVSGESPSAPRQKVKPADHIYRPGAKGAFAAKKKQDGPPIPLIGGGVLVVLVLGFLLMGHGKPALSDEQATKALQDDMVAVQAAAIAFEARNGRYPDSEEMLFKELEAKGIKAESQPVPIKLAINAPASEPYQISFRLVGDGFEVRAVDKEGRPFAVNGRDVIYTNKRDGETASGMGNAAP